MSVVGFTRPGAFRIPQTFDQCAELIRRFGGSVSHESTNKFTGPIASEIHFDGVHKKFANKTGAVVYMKAAIKDWVFRHSLTTYYSHDDGQLLLDMAQHHMAISWRTDRKQFAQYLGLYNRTRLAMNMAAVDQTTALADLGIEPAGTLERT